MIRKLPGTLICSLLLLNTLGAHGDDVDFMRSTGKIYVVIAVLLVIFIVMIIYLVVIDRKISRLEKLVRNEQGER